VGKHKVMIVDDHDVVRLGLRVLLEDSEYEVIAEGDGVAEAVRLVRQKVPDIILMDVRLADGSGVDACRQIRKEFPEVRILMLTSYEDEQAMVEAIEAGASGYLLKQISREGLREAVGKVLRGEAFLDPALAMSALSKVRKLSQDISREELLTKKEREVMLKVAEGKTNRQIAQELYLSEHTVRNHVSNILQKLGLASRVQLANYVHDKQIRH